MWKLIKLISLGLLLVSVSSCSPSNSLMGNMVKNTKSSVFHILNTNVDLVPEYYQYGTQHDCGNYTLYMRDDYDSRIELTQGTYVFFEEGKCLICNHK